MEVSGFSLSVIAAAGGIAFLHTILGPDHYLPFIVMARARSWSMARTLLVTAVCGLGHVASSILLGGGRIDRTVQPVVRQINYVPRVTLPVLVLSGRYDSLMPYETGLKPLFEALGTPAADKTLITYDTDHIPPRNEFVKEILSWLDRRLGPVR